MSNRYLQVGMALGMHKPPVARRGFLISAAGSPMPGRLERGQEEGRGLPGAVGDFEV